MLCAAGLWASGAYAADPLPTGQFVLPYDLRQVWTNSGCTGVIGYKLVPDQYYMQWNDGLKGYHFGEDWNGKCGADTDLDGQLYAVADGMVLSTDVIDDNGRGKWIAIRYTFPYAKGTNGVGVIDSEYLHLNTIETWVAKDVKVLRGQKVATIGGTGGWPVHLHWDVIWNKSTPVANLYQNPLKKLDALKYRAPSLIVDDRRVVKTVSPSTFYMDQDAPSSTAYISYNGVNKSLRQAVLAGWIKTVDIQQWDASAGMWHTYSSVDDIFFRAGNGYALWVRVSGATLNIPIPGNRFQDDRARLDMVRAIETNSMFVSVKTEVWTYIPSWDPNWEWRMMGFGRTTSGDGYVGHITNKTNPLLRYTIIWNNTTGTWGSWVLVDWNRLY